ncbi:MAG: type VI secretion system baseplate subunit TssG [Planctomycetota bacterium]
MKTLEELLHKEGHRFNFFQAVRILEKLHPELEPVGRGGGPNAEPALFRTHLSLSFPGSSIQKIQPGLDNDAPSQVFVNFLGMTGPSGVLPQHYTSLLMKLERQGSEGEALALRDWFDLFNHRMVALFYWAWKKYRPLLPSEMGKDCWAPQNFEPGSFGGVLLSLLGLGLSPLRNRLLVNGVSLVDGKSECFGGIPDLALLRFAGLLAHRPRCATILKNVTEQLFSMPVEVLQFQGNWLILDPPNQSRLGISDGNAMLGRNCVVGERVWSVENRIRVRLGPLDLPTFHEYLPDPAPVRERKSFFAICQFIRLYIGPEFDFDVQLVLNGEQIPPCQLSEGDPIGSRLGWNTWLGAERFDGNPDDAVFESEEISVFAN